jgi:hypothetical protein
MEPMALQRIKRAARPLAIMGCISIGVVYVLVGILALLALAGVRTGSADEGRMVQVVLELPAGAVLVWTTVAGLVGYVIWRGVEALADPYDFGSDWRGLAHRAAIASTAVGYGMLAWTAGRIVLEGAGSGEAERQSLVATVLAWPTGRWLVGGLGGVLLGFAVAQIYVIVRRRYLTELAIDDCPRAWRAAVHGLAGYGYAARAVILGVLGYFLLEAAWRVDPSAVGDTDSAFDFIGGGMVGDTLFFIVALGTVAYDEGEEQG